MPKPVRKKGNTVTVNMAGVSAEGGSTLFPEGPQLFEVEEATIEDSQSSDYQYIAVKLRAVDGKYEDKYAYDNVSLSPKALWKLRQLMEAGGLEVEDAEMEIDPEELIGLVVVGEVIHEEYKGKPKTKISGYVDPDAKKGDDKPAPKAKAEPEETPTRTPKRKPKAAEPDEDESAFKVKQKVKFKDGKKTVTGTITSIEGDVYTVDTGDEEFEMGAEDLEAA